MAGQMGWKNGLAEVGHYRKGSRVCANLQRTQHSVSPDTALEVLSDVEGPVACRVEECSTRRGASIGRSDAVRIISRSQRWLAELDKQRVAEEELLTEARAGWRGCSVAHLLRHRAGSELTRLCAQVVELPSSSEDSPSVDGGWSTFIGQCSSIAHCQCPGRGTLVKLPWNTGMWALLFVAAAWSHRVHPDECSVHVDVSAHQWESPRGGASKEVCKVASDQGVHAAHLGSVRAFASSLT